jgi:hypothetical protein
MSDTIVVAAISSGGAVAVAFTALMLMFQLFGSLLRRLDAIASDLKVFFKSGERE